MTFLRTNMLFTPINGKSTSPVNSIINGLTSDQFNFVDKTNDLVALLNEIQRRDIADTTPIFNRLTTATFSDPNEIQIIEEFLNRIDLDLLRKSIESIHRNILKQSAQLFAESSTVVSKAREVINSSNNEKDGMVLLTNHLGRIQELIHENSPQGLSDFIKFILETSQTDLRRSLMLAIFNNWSHNFDVYSPVINFLNAKDIKDDDVNFLNQQLPESGWHETLIALHHYWNYDQKEGIEIAKIAISMNGANVIAADLIAKDMIINFAPKSAYEIFTRILKVAPNMPKAHLMLATTAIMTGNFKLANEELKREIQVSGTNLDTITLRAQILIKQGEPFTAQIELDNILKDFPQYKYNPLILLTYAQIYFHRGMYMKALKYFNRIKRKDTNSPAVLNFSAILNSERFLFATAYDNIKLSLNSLHIAKTEILLLSTLIKDNKFDLAKEILAEIKQLYIEMPKHIIQKFEGDIAFAEHRFADAIESYKAVMNTYPPYSHEAHAGLIKTYIWMGQTDVAKKEYNVLKNNFPQLHRYKELEILIELRDGNHTNAISLANNYGNEYALPVMTLWKAFALLMNGETEKATQIVEHILKDNPENYYAQILVAKISLIEGDISHARSIADSVRINFESNHRPIWPLLSAKAILEEIEFGFSSDLQ